MACDGIQMDMTASVGEKAASMIYLKLMTGGFKRLQHRLLRKRGMGCKYQRKARISLQNGRLLHTLGP